MSFRSERLKAGKSVKEVMKKLGVSDACVYMWESGASKPRADRLKALAKFYGCTTDALLRGNNKPRSVQ